MELLECLEEQFECCGVCFAKDDEIICKHEMSYIESFVFGMKIEIRPGAHIFMSLDRYSIVMTKRMGDSGSPCLSPLSPSKDPHSCALRLMMKVTKVTQAIIHLLKISENFSSTSISFTKS